MDPRQVAHDWVYGTLKGCEVDLDAIEESLLTSINYVLASHERVADAEIERQAGAPGGSARDLLTPPDGTPEAHPEEPEAAWAMIRDERTEALSKRLAEAEQEFAQGRADARRDWQRIGELLPESVPDVGNGLFARVARVTQRLADAEERAEKAEGCAAAYAVEVERLRERLAAYERVVEAARSFVSDFEGDFVLDGEVVDDPQDRWYPLVEQYHEIGDALDALPKNNEA